MNKAAKNGRTPKQEAQVQVVVVHIIHNGHIDVIVGVADGRILSAKSLVARVSGHYIGSSTEERNPTFLFNPPLMSPFMSSWFDWYPLSATVRARLTNRDLYYHACNGAPPPAAARAAAGPAWNKERLTS